MLQLFVYLLPTFFIIIVPFSLFLGILLAFGRLSADSEVIALKASGISLYRLATPVVALGVIGCLLVAFLTLWAQPRGKWAFQQQLFSLVNSQTNATIQPQVFNTDFPGMLLFVEHVEEATGAMRQVFIADTRVAGPPVLILAASGRVVPDPRTLRLTLRLENGSLHRRGEHAREETYQVVQFARYDLNLGLDRSQEANPPQTKKRHRMTHAELLSGLAASSHPQERNAFLVELHERFSLAGAPFIFALLGIPLGIRSNRSGKGGGFAKALGVTLLYYALLTAARTVGEEGALPPALVVWAPNTLFLASAAWLFSMSAREKRIEWIDRTIERLEEILARVMRRRS